MTTLQNKKVRLLHHSHGELHPKIQPIVLEYKSRKKDKNSEDDGEERYSEGLEDVQRLEGDMVHMTQKAAKAFSKGIDAYENERQKSAKAKKDGAAEDFVHNSAKATSAFIKEASDIPVDVAESVSRIASPKRLRKNLRRISKQIGMWPL